MKKYDISIIGGAGHVGLPLSLALAQKGINVSVIDIDVEKMNRIKTWKNP